MFYFIVEMTIRVLGGLLSAYSLSNEPIFATRAIEFGNIILGAFDEEEGVFYTVYNPITKSKRMIAGGASR